MLSKDERKKLSPGTAQAQCATCNETFSNVDVFDWHRVSGKCVPIEEFAQMYDLAFARGVWATDEWHSKNEAFLARIKRV